MSQLHHSTLPPPRGRDGAASTCAVNIGFHRRSFGLYLTLFSKSFSPFPRGTCMISVSGRYLALEGSHLPHSRCTPKQRYSRTVCVPAKLCPLLHWLALRDYHPLWCGTLGRLAPADWLVKCGACSLGAGSPLPHISRPT